MRTLIFGTVYVDTAAKHRLAHQWIRLHRALNPGTDLALFDSTSPLRVPRGDGVEIYNTGDNIGHLARGGKDGWGRAFVSGLMHASTNDHLYDYVAHVEGDSLFRLPIRDIVTMMHHDDVAVASVPVRGTKRPETDWVETGLMVMRMDAATQIAAKYDWENYQPKLRYPQLPEWHVHRIVSQIGWRRMPWSAERGDQNQIRVDNVGNYDWITHVRPEVADAFVESAL